MGVCAKLASHGDSLRHSAWPSDGNVTYCKVNISKTAHITYRINCQNLSHACTTNSAVAFDWQLFGHQWSRKPYLSGTISEMEMVQEIDGWLRGPAVEHRSLAGVLSLSCVRLVADR